MEKPTEIKSLPVSPYPGLRSFNASEKTIFFGRRRQYVRMISILRRRHFLAVVGTSGCGKSSLVKAGLLPELSNPRFRIGNSEAPWKTVVARPGGGPFRNLAAKLAATATEGSSCDPLSIETRLRAGSNGFIDGIYSVPDLASHNVLIVIDQFEEIFRFGDNSRTSISKLERTHLHDDALAFIDGLLSAVEEQNPQVYLAITMRSDSMGKCDIFPGLPEAVTQSQFLPPRMNREQLLDAIRRPLELYGSSIEDAVVSDLLESMGDRQDLLPVVQHALGQLWKSSGEKCGNDRGRHITTRETQQCLSKSHASQTKNRLEWVSESITTHADQVYKNLGKNVTKEEKQLRQRIVRVMFCALSQIDSNEEPERRLSSIEEVAGIVFGEGPSSEGLGMVDCVARYFEAEGTNFVFRSVIKDGHTALDISHECILRRWGQFDSWLKEEQHSADLYRQLRFLAQQWENKNSGVCLPPQLDTFLKWQENKQPNTLWAKRYGGDYELVEKYLTTSKEQVKATRENLIAKRDADSFWVKTTDSAFGYDYYISYTYSDAHLFASALEDVLRLRGYKCFLDVNRYASGNRWEKIVQSSLRKSRCLIVVISPNAIKSEHVRSEVQAYKELRGNRRILPIVVGHEDPFGADLSMLIGDDILAIHADPGELATGPSQTTINQITKTFSFSSASRRRGGVVQLLIFILTLLLCFSVYGLVKARYEAQKAEAAEKVAIRQKYHADAARNESEAAAIELKRTVASLTKSQAIEKQQTALAKKRLSEIKLEKERILSAQEDISNRANIVNAELHKLRKLAKAAKSDAIEKVIENLSNPLLIKLSDAKGAINDCTYSRGGRYIVSGSADKKIRVYSRDGELVDETQASTSKGGVTAVAFSNDASQIVTGSAGASLRVYGFQKSKIVVPHIGFYTGPVTHFEFSNDGQKAISASGGKQNSTILFDWSNPSKPQEIASWKIGKAVTYASFNSDGTRIVTSNDDGYVRVYSAEKPYDLMKVKYGGSDLNPLLVGAPTRKMKFSPTDADLVVGGAGLRKTIWFPLTGKEIALFRDDPHGKSGPHVHTGTVLDVAFEPSGKHAATIGTDGLCLIWNANTKKSVVSLRTEIKGRLFDVEWKNTALALVGEDGSLEIWGMDNPQKPEKIYRVLAHNGCAWGSCLILLDHIL